MVQHSYTYNGRPIERRIVSIERRHFQWPWTTPTSGFKVTPFFDAEYLRIGTTCRYSFNEILIGTYTRPTQQCHFEWPLVTLSDLAKYSMTLSVAWSLCDSWASCLICNCWYTPWVDCVGWATWTTYCLGLWFLDTLWLRDENIVVETYSSPVVKRLLLLNLDKIVSGLSTGVIIDNFA